MMMKMKVVSSVKKPTTRIERGKKERVNCGFEEFVIVIVFLIFYFLFSILFPSFKRSTSSLLCLLGSEGDY